MDIDEYIQENLKLITLDNKGVAQASSRAATFLVIQAVLAAEIRNLKEALTKIETMKEVQFSVAIRASEGKNITEKKTLAACDPNYTDVRESFETLEANISYLKTHLDIFNNAHIQFRNLSRE